MCFVLKSLRDWQINVNLVDKGQHFLTEIIGFIESEKFIEKTY